MLYLCIIWQVSVGKMENKMLLAIEFDWPYLLDAGLILAITIWALIDGKRGFITCFFSFVSAIVCTLAVLFLSSPVLRLTNGLFGLEGVMQNGIGNWLCGVKPFNLDMSSDGWETVLQGASLPQFLKKAVVAEIEGLTGGIPEGTLLGHYAGNAVGSFLATGICAVVVFVATKLLMKLMRGILNRIARASFVIEKVNLLGGMAAGAFKAFALTCIALAILSLIPSQGLTDFFNRTLILKSLYNNNPLFAVFAWFKN